MKPILLAWCARMALRESRRQRTSLAALLFTILLTVALVSGLLVFSKLVLSSIELQDKSLLGADFVVKSNRSPDSKTEDYIRSLPGLEAEMIQTNSMIRIGGVLKLVQVRGISDKFPIYGEILTEPSFSNTGAFVEESLAGEKELQIGSVTLPISGVLKQVPGEIGGFGFVAPRVYLPKDALQRSGLLDFGSQSRYRYYYRGDADLARTKYLQNLSELQLEFESSEDREASITRITKGVSSFIELGALFIFILGIFGVGLSFHSFVHSRRVSFETLQAIGASEAEARSVYLILGGAVSLVGSVAGGILSQIVLFNLLDLFKPFLPLDKLYFPNPATSIGIAIALTLWILYALSEILLLRRTDLRGLAPIAIQSLVIFILLSILSPNPKLIFAGVVGLFLLSGIILILGRIAVRLLEGVTRRANYCVRFGILQVTRRLREHFLFISAIALSLLVLLSSSYLKEAILQQISGLIAGERPNVFLFDIQEDQLNETEEVLARELVARSERVPVITMRLAKINGTDTRELLTADRPQWVLRREYRTTYRAKQLDSEKVIQGEWVTSASINGDAPISLERSIAKDLGVVLGDKLTFDVQGVSVNARIASIRDVDWKSGDVNFFVIFPPGVLEEAPKYYAMLARVDSDLQLKRVEESLHRLYPNVSVMDLRVIFAGVQRLIESLAKITTLFSAALFALALTICGASLVGTLARRIEDEKLLAILGAERKFRTRARRTEFLTVSTIGVLSAAVLFFGGSLSLIRYYLDLHGGIPVVTFLGAAGLCLLVPLVISEAIARFSMGNGFGGK